MPSLCLTVLGSGTSMGVPTIGCHCRVCRSDDPHDKRTRPSVLLCFGEHYIVIDTSPDFRAQALRCGLKRLDAVIYTHGHADHILGLDDIRPFNLKQRAEIPLYGSRDTLAIIERTFAYIFDGAPTQSTIPGVRLCPIDGPFDLFGLRIVPVPALHGTMPVLGFRFGRAAYLTDFSSVPESSRKLLLDLDETLLDSNIDVLVPAYLKKLAGFLASRAEPQQLIRELLVGRGLMFENQRPDLILEDVFNQHFFPALGIDPVELQPEMERFYRDVFPSLKEICAPRPDAIEMVECAFARGWRVVIATNPVFPCQTIEHRLRWANLAPEKYPFALITSMETSHFSKSVPAYYSEIMGHLGWPAGPVDNRIRDHLCRGPCQRPTASDC